jgi:hypothetical protein
MRNLSATTCRWLAAILCSGFIVASAQDHPPPQQIEVVARLQTPSPATSRRQHSAAPPSAVLWLKPLTPGLTVPPVAPPRGGYTLLQKNKMFSPHLLVVPTGSVVMFPNADPFFHNVFSLFNGQRFDLGLYEAGKTKAVTFSREGISYIFCNIHSEMSAVVVSLSTPLYSIADSDGGFHIWAAPGDYEMHLWAEGAQQATLDQRVRRVHISADNRNLGTILLDSSSAPLQHTNKFGQPYDRNVKPIY